MHIVPAKLEHLEQLTPMFIHYRELYGAMPQQEASKAYLSERLKKQEAIILLAFEQEVLIGFCLVYPSFSSVSLRPIWILNDLYVAEGERRKHVAKKLLQAICAQAREHGAVRLRVSISTNNLIAQRLYESAGFIEDQHFRSYIALL